ncbi:hypothetical protein ACBO_31020 [Acinetobacter bouvetii]|nr:hypothetical protein ACBO_31020 [Acinetobacter bouvetii]
MLFIGLLPISTENKPPNNNKFKFLNLNLIITAAVFGDNSRYRLNSNLNRSVNLKSDTRCG